jgi:hypothetical protein
VGVASRRAEVRVTVEIVTTPARRRVPWDLASLHRPDLAFLGRHRREGTHGTAVPVDRVPGIARGAAEGDRQGERHDDDHYQRQDYDHVELPFQG